VSLSIARYELERQRRGRAAAGAAAAPRCRAAGRLPAGIAGRPRATCSAARGRRAQESSEGAGAHRATDRRSSDESLKMLQRTQHSLQATIAEAMVKARLWHKESRPKARARMPKCRLAAIVPSREECGHGFGRNRTASAESSAAATTGAGAGTLREAGAGHRTRGRGRVR